MYVNDVTSVDSCYLFADDCIIEKFGPTINHVINATNESMHAITTWYSTNLLKLNTNKTNTIILSNKNPYKNHNNQITIEGHTCDWSTSIKYLGLHIDSSLSWNDHIHKIKCKISPLIKQFSRIRPYLTSDLALTFYSSLIRPKIEYASSTIYNMSASNSKILETLQNRSMRIIDSCKPLTNSNYLRCKLNIPSLASRRKYLYLLDYHKLKHNTVPTITNNFSEVPTYGRTLRSHSTNKEFIPRANKSVGQRALHYLGPRTINSIPEYISTLTNYITFKMYLKDYLLNPHMEWLLSEE